MSGLLPGVPLFCCDGISLLFVVSGERVRWRPAYALTTRSGPLRPSLYGLITHMPASTSLCGIFLLFRVVRWLAGYTLTAHSQAEPLNRQPSGLPIGEVSSYAAKDACNASRPSLRPYNIYPAVHLILGVSVDLYVSGAYAGLHLVFCVCVCCGCAAIVPFFGVLR